MRHLRLNLYLREFGELLLSPITAVENSAKIRGSLLNCHFDLLICHFNYPFQNEAINSY